MTDLNYYSLQDFIDLTSKGRIGPSMFMDLRNLNGNQIHSSDKTVLTYYGLPDNFFNTITKYIKSTHILSHI